MPSPELIRKRRRELGLSLEDLVARMKPIWPKGWTKLSKAFLSKIENNERALLAQEIPHFAKALECEPGDLHDRLQ